MTVFLCIILFLAQGLGSSDIRIVQGGSFQPQYGLSEPAPPLQVATFLMDSHPVTREEYAGFIAALPEWRPGRTSELLADRNYLKDWQGLETLEKVAKCPVVNVSWFAARRYCRWKGGRLPALSEWEYAGRASATKPDASRDPDFTRQILDWYAKRSESDQCRKVGLGEANYWGLFDVHGLNWEWVEDFNGVFLSADSRREGENMNAAFCGGGSLAGKNKSDYAAYMRFALRSSLQGNYTLENLGFRCAYDQSKQEG